MEEPRGWFPNNVVSEANPFLFAFFPMERTYFQPGQNYTKITNNILVALYKCSFNGTELRVILAILRMTRGWNKDSKIITYSYFAREVGLDKRNVRKAIRLLVRDNVIIKQKSGRKNVFGINQDHTFWELWKTRGIRRARMPLPEG